MDDKVVARKEFQEKAVLVATQLANRNIFKIKKSAKIYAELLGRLEFELFDREGDKAK